MLVKGSFISRLINKYWVTSRYVPLHVVAELQLDLNRPIIYVVEQNCANDLLGLQATCLQAGLPDPYQAIKVKGETLSAIIFIDDWYLFSQQLKNNKQEAPYLKQYQQLLRLHQTYPDLDMQLLPTTFYWGRNPGKQNKKSWLNSLDHHRIGALHKSLLVLKNAKDHLVRFNQPISIATLCEREKSAHHFADKLAKVAVRYFSQQKRRSVGPKLPQRDAMINAILQQQSMRRVIQETAQAEHCSEAQIEAQCRSYLKEISADFSYNWLRLFRRILSALWNHIYHGIEVHHAQNVRDACQSGAEIIYMPCHRSHMDYLLLSYILFEQGLVPPHIAAGVNLNFFPAGTFFRHSGAFFIRRTFKGEPLYTEVFKSYFAMLFKQGYPIEFFTEGGRSRTGRLLAAKTGLLAMSLQTYINQPKRNLCIVPVYIGYDHIMEVNTYSKELLGQQKRSENLWQVLGSIKKLRHFGRAFVNFGEPINIKKCLDDSVPNWQRIGLDEQQFKGQVEDIAAKVMVAINASTAVNALPLCAMLLLANQSLSISKSVFVEQIALHLQLLMLLQKENKQLTVVQGSAQDIYQQALALDKFTEHAESVICSPMQARGLSYYRNNILHLFVLPSLLCHSILFLQKREKTVSAVNISDSATTLFAILQNEYFLDKQQTFTEIVAKGLKQLQEMGVVVLQGNCYLVKNHKLLTLLASHLQETFLRYQQLLLLLVDSQPNWQMIDQNELALSCQSALQAVSIEIFDKKSVAQFLTTLQKIYPDFMDQQQVRGLLKFLM